MNGDAELGEIDITLSEPRSLADHMVPADDQI